MATKKVGKAAMHAARKRAVSANKKPLPKKGDIVWIRGPQVLGIFVAYSEREKVVTLSWPTEVSFLRIWPDTSKSIFAIEREDIQLLSAAEVLDKMTWIIYYRDKKAREEVVYFMNHKPTDRLFSNL